MWEVWLWGEHGTENYSSSDRVPSKLHNETSSSVAFKREFDGRHLTPFIHILYLPEYDAFHTT